MGRIIGKVVALQRAGVQGGQLRLRPDEELSAGVYVLRVEERGQIRQHRIVIE